MRGYWGESPFVVRFETLYCSFRYWEYWEVNLDGDLEQKTIMKAAMKRYEKNYEGMMGKV